MKLNEPKVEIISKGVDPSVDFVFSDNFCPCCGTNCQKVEIEKFTKEKFLFTYYGRQATIYCPTCGTIFQKEVYDNKELKDISDIVFHFSFIILILFLLSFILFCFFNIPTGYVISLIIVIISCAVCGTTNPDWEEL